MTKEQTAPLISHAWSAKAKAELLSTTTKLRFHFQIVGDTPLICHGLWSAKAKAEILGKKL